MIWVWGNNTLSRAVHSMPDMRGRKMSMRITSGRACGISRKASSPEGQEQTQRISAKESISRHQLFITSRLSSTNATRKGDSGEGAVGGRWVSVLVMSGFRLNEW